MKIKLHRKTRNIHSQPVRDRNDRSYFLVQITRVRNKAAETQKCSCNILTVVLNNINGKEKIKNIFSHLKINNNTILIVLKS